MKKTILVVQTAFLGDLLLGIPFYKSLRAQWPDHDLVLVSKKGLLDFFIKTKLFDSGYEIEKGNSESYEQVLKKINSLNISFLFCPHESLRSAFFVQRIQADKKIGFRKWFLPWIFDVKVIKPKNWPESLRQLSLFWGLVSTENQESEKRNALIESDLFLSKNEQGRLRDVPEMWSASIREQLLKSGDIQKLILKLNLQAVFEKNRNQKKIIAVFPGSVWATKMWPMKNYIEICRKLTSQNYQVLIMGGAGEEGLADQIQQDVSTVVNLTNKTTIYETVLLLSQVDMVIGNDSASSHMAAAADVPVLSIFGPTVLEFGYRPWARHTYIAEPQKLHCRPCGPHGHKKCPLGTHECMVQQQPSAIFSQINSILNSL
jgi:heptosyltransferase-2